MLKTKKSWLWLSVALAYPTALVFLSFKAEPAHLNAAMNQQIGQSGNGGGGGGGGGAGGGGGNAPSLPMYLNPAGNYTSRLVNRTSRPQLGGGLVLYDDGSNAASGNLGNPISFAAIDPYATAEDAGMPARGYERGDTMSLTPPGQEVQSGYGIPSGPPSGIAIGLMSYTEPLPGGEQGAGAPVRSAVRIAPDPGVFDPMAALDGPLGFPSADSPDGGSGNGGGGGGYGSFGNGSFGQGSYGGGNYGM